MDRGALDVDAADPPVGVRQDQPGDHEDERAGQVVAGEPVRQDRPPEDHHRQRGECGVVHLPPSPGSMSVRLSPRPHRDGRRGRRRRRSRSDDRRVAWGSRALSTGNDAWRAATRSGDIASRSSRTIHRTPSLNDGPGTDGRSRSRPRLVPSAVGDVQHAEPRLSSGVDIGTSRSAASSLITGAFRERATRLTSSLLQSSQLDVGPDRITTSS